MMPYYGLRSESVPLECFNTWCKQCTSAQQSVQHRYPRGKDTGSGAAGAIDISSLYKSFMGNFIDVS